MGLFYGQVLRQYYFEILKTIAAQVSAKPDNGGIADTGNGRNLLDTGPDKLIRFFQEEICNFLIRFA